jgi:hypothetical protein
MEDFGSYLALEGGMLIHFSEGVYYAETWVDVIVSSKRAVGW